MIRRGEHLVEPHRFTVEDYYRMGEAGIFTEDDRVELIQGEIIQMAPIGPSHSDVLDRLNAHFSEHLRGRAVVRVQNPVRLDLRSEPQPDIVLARRKPGGYRSAHPTPAEVLLLVEVAETSRAFDRGVKLPLYAQAGIPEYWIVDLQQRAIEVYQTPAGESYGAHEQYRGEDSVAPRAFADCRLRVGELFED